MIKRAMRRVAWQTIAPHARRHIGGSATGPRLVRGSPPWVDGHWRNGLAL